VHCQVLHLFCGSRPSKAHERLVPPCSLSYPCSTLKLFAPTHLALLVTFMMFISAVALLPMTLLICDLYVSLLHALHHFTSNFLDIRGNLSSFSPSYHLSPITLVCFFRFPHPILRVYSSSGYRSFFILQAMGNVQFNKILLLLVVV
jgi:hypothetical protein